MPDWLTTLLVTIIAPGGIVTAVLLYKREDKKPAISREESQVAQAMAMSKVATALVQTVSGRLSDQDKKVLALEQHNEGQDERYNALEKTNRVALGRITLWHNWYAAFASRWEIHRLEESPPPPPEEAQLLV